MEYGSTDNVITASDRECLAYLLVEWFLLTVVVQQYHAMAGKFGVCLENAVSR